MASLIMPLLSRCFNPNSIRYNWPANMPDTLHFLREFAEEVLPSIK